MQWKSTNKMSSQQTAENLWLSKHQIKTQSDFLEYCLMPSGPEMVQVSQVKSRLLQTLRKNRKVSADTAATETDYMMGFSSGICKCAAMHN